MSDCCIACSGTIKDGAKRDLPPSFFFFFLLNRIATTSLRWRGGIFFCHRVQRPNRKHFFGQKNLTSFRKFYKSFTIKVLEICHELTSATPPTPFPNPFPPPPFPLSANMWSMTSKWLLPISPLTLLLFGTPKREGGRGGRGGGGGGRRREKLMLICQRYPALPSSKGGRCRCHCCYCCSPKSCQVLAIL